MEPKPKKRMGTRPVKAPSLSRTGTSTFPNLMIAPTLIVLLVMTAYPLIFTLVYSFTDYQYIKGIAPFNGLQNYIKLFKNPYFRQSLLNTVKFTVIAVFFETVLGLLVAVFVHGMHRGKKTMRTLLLLPYLLPPVTVALIWRMMLSDSYGIVNKALTSLGLQTFNWFYDIRTAFPMICLIDIWQSTPFVFLLLYACLQSVPDVQYEAARIDGANAWDQFRYVTIPNIKKGIFLCLLLRTIDTFRLFEKVNILTKGGPAYTTSTITQYLYNNGISNQKFGVGSAGAVIMTIFVLILSSPYIKRAIKSSEGE